MKSLSADSVSLITIFFNINFHFLFLPQSYFIQILPFFAGALFWLDKNISPPERLTHIGYNHVDRKSRTSQSGFFDDQRSLFSDKLICFCVCHFILLLFIYLICLCLFKY